MEDERPWRKERMVLEIPRELCGGRTSVLGFQPHMPSHAGHKRKQEGK